MADKEIKIIFPEEKLEALSFFMQQKNMDLEAALKEYMDKTYEKVVPVTVRIFMESKIPENNQDEPVTETEHDESGGNQRRRNQRQDASTRTTRRAQRNTEPEAGVTAPEDRQEETPAEELEETQGMNMSM